MKRLFALFTAVVLAFVTALNAGALVLGVTNDCSETEIRVFDTPIAYEDCIPLGTSREDYASSLDTTVTAYAGGYRNYVMVEAGVIWDLSAVDFNTTGTYTLSWEYVVPEGYTVADGTRLEDSSILNVYDPEHIQVVDVVSYFSCYSQVVEKTDEPLTDLSEVIFLDDTVYLKFDNLIDDSAPIEWDLSAVDTSTVGVYEVTGTVRIDDGYYVPEELKSKLTLKVRVSVQKSGNPHLNTTLILNGTVVGTWLKLDTDLLNVYRRIDGGEWTLDNAEYLDVSSTGYSIDANLLESGRIYEFYVTYGDYESDILEISANSELDIVWTYLHEGDRDGGDRDNQNLPDLIQPPAVTEAVTTTPEAPVTPEATFTGVILSSRRIITDATSAEITTAPRVSETTLPVTNAGHAYGITAVPVSDTQTNELNTAGTIAAISTTLPPVTEEVLQQGTADFAPTVAIETTTQAPMLVLAADTSDTTYAAVTEAEPKSAAEAENTAEAAMEALTEDATTINGTRLDALLKLNPEEVLFEKHGICIYVPSEYLKSLSLSDSDSLMLEILRTESGFDWSLAVNGEKVETPACHIKLPYTLKMAGASVEVGGAADTKLDTASGTISMFAPSGSYTVSESGGSDITPAPTAHTAPNYAIIVLVSVFAVAAIGVTVAVTVSRRRIGKR